MQTSLAALYKGEWLDVRTDEGGDRKRRRVEEGEGSSGAGERKLMEKKKIVCGAAEAQVSVSEHSITSSSKRLY